MAFLPARTAEGGIKLVISTVTLKKAIDRQVVRRRMWMKVAESGLSVSVVVEAVNNWSTS
jgi:hypothetical protein